MYDVHCGLLSCIASIFVIFLFWLTFFYLYCSMMKKVFWSALAIIKLPSIMDEVDCGFCLRVFCIFFLCFLYLFGLLVCLSQFFSVVFASNFCAMCKLFSTPHNLHIRTCMVCCSVHTWHVSHWWTKCSLIRSTDKFGCGFNRLPKHNFRKFCQRAHLQRVIPFAH